ncbi:MAG: glycosyltransferase family 2 protein [Spirochaetia bacterium]|nr:glycosyltransferase family 2 protein [Spirochaetia bacterium]
MVSIIIPVYNRYEMLKEAVNSVLLQKDVDFELIIADDGSTDELESGASGVFHDSRIKLLRLPHSGFPGKVRNLGAAAARGEYLAFLDSDDLWLPGKLAGQLQVFSEHPEATLVHTREIWIRNGKEISQRRMRHKRDGYIFSEAVKKCIIGPSTVMVRKETFNEFAGFCTDLEVAEDYELWLRWTARYPVFYITEPLIIKRAGNWDQLSWKYGQIEKFRIEGLHKLVNSGWFEKFVGKEYQQVAELELSEKCTIYAKGALKRDRLNEAAAYQSLAEKYAVRGKKPLPE